MKKLIKLGLISLMAFGWETGCSQMAQAWNPWTDLTQNVVWKLGQSAQAGEGYNFTTKTWDTSALAEVAEYRFLSFSYGGTQINGDSSAATDTFKVGVLSNFFFGLFKNQPTPEMAWLENLNIGPSYAIPVFSGNTGHKGTFLLDVNYRFSGS
jgi:hypothetical protein